MSLLPILFMLFPQGEQHLIDMPVMPDRAGAEIELAGGLIDDFESGDFDDVWWSYDDARLIATSS